MKHPLRRFLEFDAHHRFAVGAGGRGTHVGLSSRCLLWPVSLIASWDAFALCSVVLAWAGMISPMPERACARLRRRIPAAQESLDQEREIVAVTTFENCGAGKRGL